MTVIDVKKLQKRYKNGVEALSGISLTVQSGEIFALLGENGAGKSTLINILTTYLQPSGGTVFVFGEDLYENAGSIRTRIACVAQHISIDTHLSLTENMMFQSWLYKIPKAEAAERMNRLIDAFGLAEYAEYPVSSYSGGIKRRLDIALNMMSNPKILFMDEPTVGMDIGSRKAMWDMMNKIRMDFGTTIFLTTHYLEEADQLSDNICIMKNGRDIIQGTPSSLRGVLRQDMLQISFPSKEQALASFGILCSELNLKNAVIRDNHIAVSTDHGLAELNRINRFLLDQDVIFTGIAMIEQTLDDVFLRLTGTDKKEGGL